MSEPYYSRRYLAEKFGALARDMVDFLEVGCGEDLGDQIAPETMARCRDNIVDKCRAIEYEVTKSGGEATRIVQIGGAGPEHVGGEPVADALRDYACSDLKGGSLLKTLKDVTGCEGGSWRDVLLRLADLIEPVVGR